MTPCTTLCPLLCVKNLAVAIYGMDMPVDRFYCTILHHGAVLESLDIDLIWGSCRGVCVILVSTCEFVVHRRHPCLGR